MTRLLFSSGIRIHISSHRDANFRETAQE